LYWRDATLTTVKFVQEADIAIQKLESGAPTASTSLTGRKLEKDKSTSSGRTRQLRQNANISVICLPPDLSGSINRQ
jgi:hypothetical protein